MNKITWKCKCNNCGAVFHDLSKLPKKPNPSGIIQEVCEKCGYGVTLYVASVIKTNE